MIAIKACPCLSANKIKSSGVSAVFEMLKFNKGLRELNLSRLSSSLFFSFLCTLFKMVSFCTESNVRSSEIAVLVNALEANTSLRELELQRISFHPHLFVNSVTLNDC